MKRFFLLLALVALVTGIGVSYFSLFSPPSGDGVHYQNFAQSILAKGQFAEYGKLASDRDPGYVFFLAIIQSVFGQKYFWIHFFQFILFLSLPFLIYFLSYELFGKTLISQIASIFTACLYQLALYIGYFYTEILFTFLIICAIYFFIRAEKEVNFSWYAVSGIFFGIAILTRSVILYFPLFFLLVYLFYQRNNLKQSFFRIFVFSSCVLLIVLPWMFRNERLFGTFTVSNQAGSVLFFAVQRVKIENPDLPKVFTANLFGDYFSQKLFGSYERQKIEEGNYGQRYTELGQKGLSAENIDETIKSDALKIMKDHPLRYLLVAVPIEFLKLFTPIFPAESIQGLFSDGTRYANIPSIAKASIIFVVRLVFYLFYGLTVYGIILALRHHSEILVCVSFICYLVIVYSLLHGIPRYLVPVLPAFTIFSAFAIDHIINKKITKNII